MLSDQSDEEMPAKDSKKIRSAEIISEDNKQEASVDNDKPASNNLLNEFLRKLNQVDAVYLIILAILVVVFAICSIITFFLLIFRIRGI